MYLYIDLIYKEHLKPDTYILFLSFKITDYNCLSFFKTIIFWSMDSF